MRHEQLDVKFYIDIDLPVGEKVPATRLPSRVSPFRALPTGMSNLGDVQLHATSSIPLPSVQVARELRHCLDRSTERYVTAERQEPCGYT